MQVMFDKFYFVGVPTERSPEKTNQVTKGVIKFSQSNAVEYVGLNIDKHITHKLTGEMYLQL